MNLRRLLAPLLALFVGALVFLLWPRAKVTPEDEVRALIAKAVSDAERHDVGDFMQALSDDFHGPSGTSRDEVKGLVAGQLFRNSNQTSILNPSLQVTVNDPSHARFEGVFVFARAGQLTAPQAGDGASRYDIDGSVERREGRWVITSATWRGH